MEQLVKIVPAWCWWLIALVLVAGGQQYRVVIADGAAADARAETAKSDKALADYRLETGLDLLGAVAIQTGPASEGLQRQWDAPDLGLDKHHGYAFQWFGLCALLVGLYVWFQGLAPRRRARAGERD